MQVSARDPVARSERQGLRRRVGDAALIPMRLNSATQNRREEST